ncbi:hypothetical protein AUJ63_05200 [Candidatus Pacearchaeota archaeon CG1_02_35_32]|nr:MAG: hypothetical protein AUJ63_05200 [Candidatus Pacearchaeota archaeon CG1_02_35_32]
MNGKWERRKQMKKLLLIIIVMFCIIGCAKKVYYKENYSVEQARQDYLECKLHGDSVGMLTFNPLIAAQLTRDCMLAKGYSIVNLDQLEGE